MARPPLDDCRHGLDEAVAGTRGSESGKEEAEIVVMEVELGTAVGVRGVDPLAAAEKPVTGVTANIQTIVRSASIQRGTVQNNLSIIVPMQQRKV